jgi:transketolase
MPRKSFEWPSQSCDSEVGRKAIRQSILEQIYLAKSGHPGGSLSLVEILSSIFSGNFEHTSENPTRPDRDRIVLSKGHGVPALYSLLSYMRYFDSKELSHLRKFGHFLQGHPDKSKFALMETSTGSLGQGVSVALGLALGLRHSFLAKELPRLPIVYAILGDGEFQEGQVWECLMAAGKFLPGNLVFILDRNRGQIDGPVEEIMDLDPLDEKIKSFRWNVHSVDGHNVEELKRKFSSLEISHTSRPNFILANTIKGKGISFMEHPTNWHGAAPKKEDLQNALAELFPESSGVSPFGSLVQE